MHVKVGHDRSLQIDGIDRGMVESTKITGGAASIVTIKPEGTSESEATFDGLRVRQVALGVLVHDRGGTSRYDAVAAIAAMARKLRADVPERHDLEGPLTDAVGVKRVICLSMDPVDETSEADEVRLSLLLEEVDPTVALRARDAATAAQANAQATADAQAAASAEALAPSTSDESRLETYWGDEF
ncbi:MAG: hypothetical protein OXC31_26560 [Spirochaetaceae bacterium]|nr:hypothetical protein [Spirochaetaceae bacterium]